MAKKILLALSLFAFATFFCFAQNGKIAESTNNISTNNAEVEEQKGRDDEARITRRVELQVKKLAEDLNLSDKQVEAVKKIYVESEKRSIELRNQLNSVNRERAQKIDELLTEEQLKLKREPNRRNVSTENPSDDNNSSDKDKGRSRRDSQRKK